jgi:hypothetical protein
MCTPAKAGAQNADTNLACFCNGPRLSPERTKGWIRSCSVIPAKAGISPVRHGLQGGIPAFAGMTTENGQSASYPETATVPRRRRAIPARRR